MKARALGWVALLTCALAALGCALPDYEKITSGDDSSRGGDAGSAPSVEDDALAACASDFPATGACGACVAEHCCEEVAACDEGACGEDVGFPISPVMNVNDEFDALVSCMQQHCDTEATCDVSWGCVDRYRWPPLREERRFGMRIFNYADVRETGLSDIEVKFCESSDPNCDPEEGLLDSVTTRSDGLAEFIAPRGFTGYFLLSGGKPTPAVVQWSQPIHNFMDVFAHQALFPDAVVTLAKVVGWRQDGSEPTPGTGHLLVRAQSCLPYRYLDRTEPSSRGRDVVIDFSPRGDASRVYYVSDMAVLDPTLESTTSRGYAGAFEVPARNIAVTAKHVDSGKTLASGVVMVLPDTIGYLYLFPNPSR